MLVFFSYTVDMGKGPAAKSSGGYRLLFAVTESRHKMVSYNHPQCSYRHIR